MDEDVSDSDSEESVELFEEIEDWDGIDVDALDDMMVSIRSGVDNHDKRVAGWCHALLQRELWPFYRARLNFYLASTPGERPQDRLDIAGEWIKDAADEEDITGLNLSEDIVAWKSHILSTRDSYERLSRGLPDVDDDDNEPAIPVLDVTVDSESVTAPAGGEFKPLPLRQASTYLGVRPDAMMRTCFGRPPQQPRRSRSNVLNETMDSQQDEAAEASATPEDEDRMKMYDGVE